LDDAVFEQAQAYRRHAAEVRAQAHAILNAEVRHSLFRLVDSYERLADNVQRAAERQNSGPPSAATYALVKPRLVFNAQDATAMASKSQR
jgi:hypothetical protein